MVSVSEYSLGVDSVIRGFSEGMRYVREGDLLGVHRYARDGDQP